MKPDADRSVELPIPIDPIPLPAQAIRNALQATPPSPKRCRDLYYMIELMIDVNSETYRLEDRIRHYRGLPEIAVEDEDWERLKHATAMMVFRLNKLKVYWVDRGEGEVLPRWKTIPADDLYQRIEAIIESRRCDLEISTREQPEAA